MASLTLGENALFEYRKQAADVHKIMNIAVPLFGNVLLNKPIVHCYPNAKRGAWLLKR